MCRVSPSYRFESSKVLRHPWITRDSSSPIPESLVESFSRISTIKKFQNLLGAVVALNVYKATNLHLFSKIKTSRKNSKLVPEKEDQLLDL
jgi:hypothetical protein